MPKQSRGFWTCNYCGYTFDSFEEADYHEHIGDCRQQHPHPPPPPASTAPTPQHPYAASEAAAYTPQQHQPPHPPPYAQHYHQPPPPPHAAGSMPPHMRQQDVALQHLPPPLPTAYDYEAQAAASRRKVLPPPPTRGGSRQRRFILMDPHQEEVSHLSEADTAACRNIEIFETVEGEVGIRCSNCAYDDSASGKPASAPSRPGTFDFPANLGAIGDGVRMLAEHHLNQCRHVPPQTRQLLDRVVRERQQKRENQDDAWHEEEQQRRVLIDYCARMCQRMGIINRYYPPNSGILFGEYIPVAEPLHPVAPQAPPPPMGAYAIPAGPPRQPPGPQHQQQRPPARTGTPMRDSSSVETTPTATRRRLDVQMEAHETPAQYNGHEPGFDGGAFTPYDVRAEDQGQQQAVEGGMVDRGGHQAELYPMAEYHEAVPAYDMPTNFPFLQESNGDWVCKYCNHLHPQYRDPHFHWSTASKAPPTASFIDNHLRYCRAYQHSLHSVPFEYQGPPTPYSFQSRPPGPYSPQAPGHPGWESPGGEPTRVPGPMPGMSPAMGEYAPQIAEPFPHTPAAFDPFSPQSMSTSSGYQVRRQSMKPPFQHSPAEPAVEDDNEIATRRAIQYLVEHDKTAVDADGNQIPEDARLVLGEDSLLLTDYFFFLMKQLTLVRFSESDRKTRGGKREKIQVGYGGLQCVHCAEAPNARKFFWSNVDRLANSFAEIPSHVLKCRRCPQPIKDALHQLKKNHPDQMSRLPRGSQKVFFRRMWRRLHDEDPSMPAETPTDASTRKPPPSLSSQETGTTMQELDEGDLKPEAKSKSADNSPGTSGSDESILMFERSTEEGAKALADSAMQGGPPSPSSRVLLAVPEDKQWLSDTDCFIRRQLEIFCATKEDVETAQADRKYPVHEGQVGIRCIHCAMSKKGPGATGSAVAYPFSVSGIYESVREFQRLHLDSCDNLPPSFKSKLASMKGASSLTSVLRKYYVLAAKALGLQDTKDGIRAGSETIRLASHAAFAFSESSSKTSEEMARLMATEQTGTLESPASAASQSLSRKRSSQEPPGTDESKKQARSYQG